MKHPSSSRKLRAGLGWGDILVGVIYGAVVDISGWLLGIVSREWVDLGIWFR